jgi:phosphoribosylamine--glycine ligase
MYLGLLQAGHDVRTYVEDERWHDILRGSLKLTRDWKQDLDWLREDDGIVIFERADAGELQDQLRRDGFNVIGGSAFGDRMENDRAFGQECMRAAGIRTVPVQEFNNFDAAIDFIERRPRRYVLKLNGADHASSCNLVGDMDRGEDISAILHRYKISWSEGPAPSFVLMDYVSGVEVGVGAYFNGESFLEPVVMDWEHKRFFPGDMGELTGEMGTLLTYRGGETIFRITLAKMAEQLREGSYVGYININTIVDADGVWPLEFTCRFGYPGAAICSTLHLAGWDLLFRRMIDRDRLDFRTQPGFAAGVVLTVPPFPVAEEFSLQSKGLPILFRTNPTEEDWSHFQLSEVEKTANGLVTTGGTGSLMAVTGTGGTADEARKAAYRRCANIVVPGLRYRQDIGLRFIERDAYLMRAWGYLPG